MSAPLRCHVVGGEKLTAAEVRPSVLCPTIEEAIAAAAPNARYTAELRVLSPSTISAVLTVHGRTLPEQKMAVMDRPLNAAAVRRFADALAAEVAKAAKD